MYAVEVKSAINRLIDKASFDSDFFFQAEDGIRDPLWSRGLGDVYKRQIEKLLL